MEKINQLIEEVRLAEIKKIKVYSEEQKNRKKGLDQSKESMTETN